MIPLRPALACALWLALSACRSTPEVVEAPGAGFLGALALPSVGPTRYARCLHF